MPVAGGRVKLVIEIACAREQEFLIACPRGQGVKLEIFIACPREQG